MSDPKRAVAYLRVSTGMQERDGVSLEAQLDMARRFCEYRGLEMVGTYTDVMSGSDDRRPELAKLEADLARKAFDAVLVYKVDRLSRDSAHYHALLQRFAAHDVRLASLTQDIDATTSFGKFVMSVLIAAAEMEAGQTGDRVRDSYRQRAEMGRPLMGGPATIGYRYVRRHINEAGERVPGRLEVDVTRAAMVRWIFDRFIETHNIYQVVVEAAALGYTMPSGRPFNRQGVYRILRNTIYRGEYVAL
jgi:site-specific DNA recombinase